jgi:tetratricopeptide (TPR) repeat protein
MKKFHRLAAEATTLQHPNVLQVIETGNDVDAKGRVIHFLATEPVPGLTLAALVSKKVPVAQLAGLFLGVAEALEACHQKHVLHPRLLPWEVLVDLPSRVLISTHELALTGFVEEKGTAAAASYLAPEQVPDVEGGEDERSDLYRLGVLMYEAVTGRNCFAASTESDAHRNILEAPVPAPSTLHKGGEPELETIIARLMSRPKELRYQAASEVVQALRHFLKKESAPASKTTRRRIPTTFKMKLQILRARNRSRFRVGVLLGILVLVAAGGGVWHLIQRRLREEVFSRDYVAAFQLHQAGKLREAIDAANRAQLEKPSAELAQLAADCRRSLVEAAVLQNLADLEHASYGAAAEAPAYEVRRVALERRLPELSSTIAESREAAQRSVLGLAGRANFALGDSEGAEVLLRKAMPPGPVDPKIPLTLARAGFQRLVAGQALGHPAAKQKGGRPPGASELQARLQDALSRPVLQGRTTMEEEIAEIYRSIARGDREGARLLAEQGVERIGKTVGAEEFRILLGWASTEPESLQDLDKAVEQRPHGLTGYLVRGWRRQDAGDLTGAIADYDQALRLAPTSPELLLLRGRARRLSGDLENALADLRRCRPLAPPGWIYQAELEGQISALQASAGASK